jgi:hypothetical protein
MKRQCVRRIGDRLLERVAGRNAAGHIPES